MAQKRTPRSDNRDLPAPAGVQAPAQLDLKIDILKSEDRVVLPVGGVFGGLNHQNQLVAHFYVEYPDLPETGRVNISVGEAKLLENSLSFRPDHITREIVATIIIPPHLTSAFAGWFQMQSERIAASKSVELK